LSYPAEKFEWEAEAICFRVVVGLLMLSVAAFDGEQERAEGTVGAQTMTNRGSYPSPGIAVKFRAFGCVLCVPHASSHPSGTFPRRVRMNPVKHRPSTFFTLNLKLAFSLSPCGSCSHQADRYFDRYGTLWLPAHALVLG